ncbi:MAG: polyprenyl synthetase family protein [Prolixibacteraceae bacterium]|jgi:geranylgeranyl diphosphate synthase type II|nr:polyprenyl synthetase family protein [Prolixibacteraceae bacterium]
MLHFDELVSLFNTKLEQEIAHIEKRKPQNLYEPVIYTLNMGGKRIRPVLLLLAHQLYNNNFENAFPAAIAIEMFHNFTLLHDDIMDNADLRRNFKTVHLKYNNETAILSGDAMSILSYEYITQCQSKNYREIFELFTQTALKICEGQQFDMDFETRSDVSVDEYLEMIGLKTAILLAASLKMGALTANATTDEANLLYEFGYNLGMAFQLQDDILDTFGETTSFGKIIGGDIVANKKTFLMLNALELAKGETLSDLEKLLSVTDFNRQEKIQKVKNIYNVLGVVKLSQQKMDDYYNKAISNLDLLNVDENRKKELFLVANKMMKRKS